jgi:hypothetical protein
VITVCPQPEVHLDRSLSALNLRRFTMITTTMRRLVPDELITPLKILGKYDWLRWTSRETPPLSTSVEVRLPTDPALLKFHQLIPLLRGLVEVQAPHLFELYTYSKALAEGPKLLRPAAEQCEALEHVDVNISFDDYVQPFPTFLLELPEAYRRRLTDRFGFECPQLVVTHHDSRTKYILSFRSACPSGESTCHIMSPRWNTVEEALRFSEDEGNDLDQSEVIQRVALNFGLLMTYYGVRDRGPADPQSHATHLRNARRRNKGKADRARHLLDAEINVIEFEQDVVVYDRSETQHSDSEGDGSTRRTHWRRGHFRRQVCGHARSGRKLIFIKPILVNAHRFQGDVADTEYRLKLSTV